MSAMETSVLWPAELLAAATGGRMTVPFAASGVSIDSRTLRPADLFVALAGEHREGHVFVADALGRAAAGAMVSRVPSDVPPTARLLVVDDTLIGLARLGQFARGRSTARVAAITGSVGKTTTKEMLRQILAAKGPTHAARASYNNQWGVPLTLAELPPNARFAVVEIGANHTGEIAPLAALARPHVALITAIANAHIGFFGTLEAIADEKASLLASLEPHGTAILPRDTPFLARLAARAPQGCRVVTFGEQPLADARLIGVETNSSGMDVTASISGKTVRFRLTAAGKHMALDALAALAAAEALDVPPEAAARSLAGFAALPGRGARRAIALPRGEALLLDESYNASPASVVSALEVLAHQIHDGCSGRRIAVLGDMLELGETAAEEHAALAPTLARSADLFFACGMMTRRLFDLVPKALRGAYAIDAEALAPIVAAAIAPGDVVLVKGSLGSRMRHVVAALTAVTPANAGECG